MSKEDHARPLLFVVAHLSLSGDCCGAEAGILRMAQGGGCGVTPSPERQLLSAPSPSQGAWAPGLRSQLLWLPRPHCQNSCFDRFWFSVK